MVSRGSLNNLFKSISDAFLQLCIYIYRFFKYVGYGLISPFVFIIILVNKKRSINVDKLKIKATKEKEKSDKKIKHVIDTTAYKNENIKLEKKTLGDLINAVLSGFVSIPAIIKKKIDNISLVKQARNKKAFDTKTMLVDFSDEDKDNDGKRIVWEYIAINNKGRKVRGFFEAFSRVDVQSFLLGEGLSVYSIKTSKQIQLSYKLFNSNRVVIKKKDLIFMLTQLSTYLKSGIPLVDSLNILIKQTQKKSYKAILREVTYDLTVGENFSSALEKRGIAFPKLLINMVKASELTGELPEALDDMVTYYTESEQVRKEMTSALTYPMIVFIFTLAVVTFMMVYVVPKFVEIYNSMEASEIPSFTLLVINISDYLEGNIIKILLIIISALLVSIYLYKNVKIIRTLLQWVFMHIPVLKDVIIYNEVTIFSKTFASLLAHNVYITDSMEILNKVTNNEIYKMMILDTVANLARGDRISAAFENQWAFPVPAYEMIVTGEKTGQLSEMMSKVSTYYQSLHKSTVAKIKALIEPFLIVFLTFAVGVILLAVIIPMFNMYQQVQNLG